MKFSSTQMALMSRLLDEVVDAQGRNRWLENFKLARGDPARPLCECAAAIGARTVLGCNVGRAAQHYVW
jgi:hypothetical protein